MIAVDTILETRERYLVPDVLAPFAHDLARRLSRLISSGPLLEIAADTGVLTQANAAALSVGVVMIATDPNAEMVAYARAKPGVARVNWQQADPAALPFPDSAFGVVACHFAVSAMADRVRVFQEARRVMRPGGRFVFSVPGPLRHNPVPACLLDALGALFPADPPRYIDEVMHGYAEADWIDDDLTAAGFTDAVYTQVDLPYAASSAHAAAAGYCLGSALRTEIEARTSGTCEAVSQAAAAALERRFGRGPIAANMRAQLVSAAG